MKSFRLLLAAALLCAGAFAQPRPDFSGTWKLNAGKSAQDGAAEKGYTVTIEHSGATIKLTTKAEGVTNIFDGTFKIDGKPHIVKRGKANYRFTKVGWEAGNTLTFEITDKDSTKETAKVTFYVRQTWTLSPDQKVLTEFRRTAEVAKPIADRKYVFDKQ